MLKVQGRQSHEKLLGALRRAFLVDDAANVPVRH
jgi:hypothetical protein